MIDEIFFKRAKEAIVEHFNSHCKVGDLFEDEVKTREDFVCPVWYNASLINDEMRAIFNIASSKFRSVFYSAVVIPKERKMRISVLKEVGSRWLDIDEKDAEACISVTMFTDPGEKTCEVRHVRYHKTKIEEKKKE